MNVSVERPLGQFEAAERIGVLRDTPSRSAARSASLRIVMQQQDLVEVADLAVEAGEELALARIGLEPLLDARQRLHVRFGFTVMIVTS